MTYVVYNTKSTIKMKTFATETGAKRSTTCMNRNAVDRAAKYNDPIVDVYAYTDEENYNKNVVYKKTVKNLISGKDVEIDSNTPACCDPSTETYWSM